MTPSPAGGEEIKSIKEIHVEAPRLSSDRIARVSIHIEAQDGLRAGFELQWRYPEGTLQTGAKTPNFENLFTLAAVLPILNYLPFSDSFRVDGPLDAGDAEWIGRLAEATAREIQRQKLTPDNPFLRTEVLGQLNHEPLAVPVPRANTARVAPLGVEADPRRAAVILNGAAGGILSWAILREIGPLPLGIVFDNPATRLGAATNIYDTLKSRSGIPIARIWTNLSHLYDFFLRHLDILRANYQTVRADTTPLRLFEAEVGVLAVLPLLWSNGIGHVVMPRRPDPLERRGVGGTLQSQPLFDQTRPFDDYVSRFFSRKGWGVQQWSMLRPAGELVVQRALGTRYPDLFPLQVGCLRPRLETRRPVFVNGAPSTPDRAGGEGEPESPWHDDSPGSGAPAEETVSGNGERPHTGGREGSEESAGKSAGQPPPPSPVDRVQTGLPRSSGDAFLFLPELVRALPCGACEACRRLVAILTALGYDPRGLGYSPTKIERALSHTRRVGHLPPEARIQRHVLYLLEKAQGTRKLGATESGVREKPTPAGASEPAKTTAASPTRLEPQPEVEALRFDGTRTFIDTIPLPFRKPVYSILLESATGALRREGREWKPFDLLSSPEIDLPKHPRDLEFLVT